MSKLLPADDDLTELLERRLAELRRVRQPQRFADACAVVYRIRVKFDPAR